MLSEAGYKEKHEEGLKINTSKQIHQRLPIALAQVKEGNTSENLLNEIQEIYIFCIKEVVSRCYLKNGQQYIEFNKSIIQNGYYIFMNSRNSKTPYSYRLLLNPSEKINLKRSIHMEKVHMEKYKNNKFQVSARILNEEFFLYQIFKIILSISSKSLRHLLIIFQ